jgi:hypothetical protein
MSGQFPSKNTVERVRKQYPKGTRVELLRMDDHYATLKAGECGTVEFVDDTGTVFVAWDCGSHMGCVFGEDALRKLPYEMEKIRKQVLAIRELPGCPNMFDAVRIQRLAFENDFYELADFIETDVKAYANFILTGGER